MIANLVAVAVLVVLVALVILGIRASWRTRRPAILWPATILGGLVVVIGAALTAFGIRGMTMAYARGGRPVQEMTIERTPERVARGEHIVGGWCVACHSQNHQLPASGGLDIAKEIPFPIGALPSGNLTPGGRIATWSDGEIYRAIREGYDPTGKKLLVMSAQYARYLSDEDLRSVIAYLRTQPAVKTEMPAEHLSFLGVVMAGASMFPSIDEPPPVSVTAPPRGETAEYGRYIVSWMNCRECHGPNLAGQTGGILPPAPSLRPMQTWTTDQFVQAMRTGTTPFGKNLDSTMMPWRNIGRFDDDELRAVHTYLKALDIPLPAK